MPFDYPAQPHTRRHGPQGYVSYESYRPWLRDDFSFQCIYCRKREQWCLKKGEYHVDHFSPHTLRPDLESHYDNLHYTCTRCNVTKGDQILPDPTRHLTAENVRLLPNGEFEGLSTAAVELVWKLDLNSSPAIEWRLCWIRIVELAKEYDPDLYRRLMGFPNDLPNLLTLRPPGGNVRPNGVRECYYARRERGDLPETY